MAAFLDVYLEQIAQVVKRGCGVAKHALLLDRRRLGIALGNDQTAQYGAEFTRNLLPDFLPIVVAKANLAIGVAVGEKDSPAIIRHVDESIGRPTLRVHRGRGAKINVRHLKIARTEVLPPLQKFRLPVFQSALQGAVGAEIYVVWNAVLIIDCHCKAPISEFRFRTCNRGPRPTPSLRRLGWSHSLPIEARLRSGAEQLERALFAGRVRPDEYPVLPRGQAAKHLGLRGFRPREAQAGFHAGERVG